VYEDYFLRRDCPPLAQEQIGAAIECPPNEEASFTVRYRGRSR